MCPSRTHNNNAVVFQISVYRAAATSNPPTLTDLPVVQMDSKGNQELSQISPHPSVTTVSASIAVGRPNALLGDSPNTPYAWLYPHNRDTGCAVPRRYSLIRAGIPGYRPGQNEKRNTSPNPQAISYLNRLTEPHPDRGYSRLPATYQNLSRPTWVELRPMSAHSNTDERVSQVLTWHRRGAGIPQA